MVGTLDDGTRRTLVLLLAAWVQGDVDGLVDGFVRLGVVQWGVETPALRSDLRWVLGRYHDAQLADIRLDQVLGDVFRMIRRHRVVLRGDLALMAKTLIMQEGLGLTVYPEFVFVNEVRPTVDAALRRLLLPRPDMYSAALNVQALIELGATFPQRAERLLGQFERGEFGVQARLPQLDTILHFLHHLINRVVIAFLVAASLLGLASVLNTAEAHGSPLMVSVFTIAMFVTIALGLWLAYSMIRTGRHRL
jgi:ubiquinone biosynthesis protein